MANVSWSKPGTSGDWDASTNWTGLPPGASYPGQIAISSDLVTLDGSNGPYTVTFNVPDATIGDLTVVGGNGKNSATTLQMTAGNTLTIIGGVTLETKVSTANIDGAGTISVSGPVATRGALPHRR